MKEEIKKILAINFGGIGDEILFLPTLISLKKEFPDASISLALEPRSKGIKDLTSIIDEVIPVDIKFKNKYIELLKLVAYAYSQKFDMVISSGGNKFISILLFLMGIKYRYGFYTGKLSELLLTKAVPLNKNQYASLMYHDLISPITNEKTSRPVIELKKEITKEANTILIHPGVSKLSVKLGMIKTITPKLWAEVVDKLLLSGKKVILTGGPDDKECLSEIKQTMTQKDNSLFVDYEGKTKNLMELAELIASAEKFVCSDSAPLHVAVGVGTRTFVIFGPTDYNKLIPSGYDVTPILAKDTCAVKPCLWERRQKTCKSLECLKMSADDICNYLIY